MMKSVPVHTNSYTTMKHMHACLIRTIEVTEEQCKQAWERYNELVRNNECESVLHIQKNAILIYERELDNDIKRLALWEERNPNY